MAFLTFSCRFIFKSGARTFRYTSVVFIQSISRYTFCALKALFFILFVRVVNLNFTSCTGFRTFLTFYFFFVIFFHYLGVRTFFTFNFIQRFFFIVRNKTLPLFYLSILIFTTQTPISSLVFVIF
jgi:hypothetical protein